MTRLLLIALAIITGLTSVTIAQNGDPPSVPSAPSAPSDPNQPSTDLPPIVIQPNLGETNQYSHPRTERWQFGIEIEATSDIRGITASFPIPIGWPEQDVSEPTIIKTDGVGRASEKAIGKTARQVVVKIPRLSAGETARVIYQYDVTKKIITAPGKTDRLTVPETVPSVIRKFLRPSPFIESRHQRIIEIAEQVPTVDPDTGEALPAWNRAEWIYNWVRDNIEYRFDSEIHSCLHALDTGRGDCEEMSSLFVAICRASGIPARAVLVPGHTYPEIYLHDSQGEGHWYACQAAGTYSFGHMIEYRPIVTKGDSFRVPGLKGLQRYVKPSFVAKDLRSAPVFRSIEQRIETPGDSE